MVRWLVDGMNVIGSRPNRWWEAPEHAIAALVEDLREFAAATGDTVTVVFDFRPKGFRAGARGGVKVHFGDGGPQAADEFIARAVPTEPAGVRVVTSDRRLRQIVESLGAAVEPVTSFRQQLDAAAGRARRTQR